MSLIVLFDSSGGVPIPTISASDINILSKTLVSLTLVEQVVVNDAYYDPANYVLTGPDGPGPAVVSILRQNNSSTYEIILVTNTLPEGVTYTLSFSGLSLRSGVEPIGSGDFETRSTKLDSILRSIPNHYDTRSSSNLHALLAAIGASDDLIGGSRSDSITFD